MSDTVSKVVIAQIDHIKVDSLLPNAFATASAEGVQVTVPINVEGVHQVKLTAVEPVIVLAQESLDYAAEVARRINSKESRDKIAAALLSVDESVSVFAQRAADDIFCLAEDVLARGNSARHVDAVMAAKRVTDSVALATIPHTKQAGEMLALAYAVLHYSTKG